MSQPAFAPRTLPRITAGRAAALLVAAIWLTHGLYSKLLGGAPRHLAIVQAVPGFEGTTGEHVLAAVGALEVVFAVWVLSAWRPHVCAAAQTVTLLSMNALELTYARHLLLWPEGLLPLNTAFLLLAWTAAAAARHAAEPAAPTALPADTTRSGAGHTHASRAKRLRARLRRHPFAIEAHFDWCLSLTYALPADRLRSLLPPGLELDTRDGLGFLAVALVQTRSLRPAGLPGWLGQDFFLAGYRVFTRFRQADGRVLRGLRILRSDADRVAMVAAGNLLTHYHYTPCRPVVVAGPQATRVITVETHDGTGDLHVVAHLDDPSLPAASPFPNLRQARCFAGPMPFTFDYEPEAHGIVVVGSRRTNWAPTPVRVEAQRVAFFDAPVFARCAPVLSAAFLVENVDYRWERGVLSSLRGSPPGGAA